MANLIYPSIIERDPKFKALAETGLLFKNLDSKLLMTNQLYFMPADLLELLAEKRSLTGFDGWSLAQSLDSKYSLLKSATEMHRKKGTPWAIREVVRRLGFGECEIVEGLSNNLRNGTILRDGTRFRGDNQKWNHYRIILNTPITVSQAVGIRKTVKEFAPCWCKLDSLDYREVSILRNGTILRDGTYKRGEA